MPLVSIVGWMAATAIARTRKGNLRMSNDKPLRIQAIIDRAADAYSRCPDSLRAAVLRSGCEIVPVLDRIEAGNSLALAAAAAVAVGHFQMIASEIRDDEQAALYRVAYLQLIARGIDRLSLKPGVVQ